MQQDRLSMMSRNQAVTASAWASYVLDLKDHGDDVNRLLTYFVQVRTAATADGNATVTFQLYTGDTLDGSGDISGGTLIHSTAAIGKAALTDGAFPVKIALPPDVGQYLQLYYTVATGPLTAGKFDAGLAWGIDLP